MPYQDQRFVFSSKTENELHTHARYSYQIKRLIFIIIKLLKIKRTKDLQISPKTKEIIIKRSLYIFLSNIQLVFIIFYGPWLPKSTVLAIWNIFFSSKTGMSTYMSLPLSTTASTIFFIGALTAKHCVDF